ncbi:GSCOCG00010497001-RA-CDS [Cotesia congregata]|uniref:6-phosphogluconolactonase n=1 Tax=Cotesia congregata TaxID=51543 RepID=A0A8J2MH40_COTCN|nr:GSCOCG00010497001-RA-CDS [Cotesia congregata]CAG5080746.1 Similar to Pgls: 6-phosphogluconolactonase (Rattus norvegicus) [Cotesia congregata]
MENVLIEPDVAGVIKKLSSIIEEHANDAIKTGDVFKIGLSGGSLIKFLAEGLPSITTDWSKWRFFFCDERIVPFDNEDSTYGQYKASLMGKIPITEDQFITIDTEHSAVEAANDYIMKMSVYFPPDSPPRFDLLLLGIGPDGHTCSLFPGHRLLEETIRWVCPINDSPKPPPSRITLTFPVINNSKACVFAVAGASKADIIKRVLKEKENLPAGRVNPTNGSLYWIVDQEAAKGLNA